MLTDSLIAEVRPTTKKQKLSDEEGLYVEVLPSGRKTFRLRYRFDNAQKDIRLGQFGIIRLSEARFRRDQARQLLAEGRDPATAEIVVGPPLATRSAVPARPSVAGPGAAPVERRLETAAPEERTDRWSRLAKEYLDYRVRAGAHYRTRAKLERQVLETIRVLGHTPVADVTASDILALVKPFEMAGKVETAHELRARCAQILDYAEALGYPNTNPAARVSKAMMPRRRGTFPGLIDPKAVGALMRDIWAFDQCEPETRWGLMLSAYLFPRSDQLRGALWSEIDFKAAMWEIPGHRMKGSDAPDHLVPLAPQVVTLLQEIADYTADSRFILPSPRGKDAKLSDTVFNAALRKMGYDTRTEHCHHGFRITASTNLNEMGFNRDWIERQLAHVDGNAVRAGYNKAQYLRGRTEMMHVYADWIDKIRSDEQERSGARDSAGQSGHLTV